MLLKEYNVDNLNVKIFDTRDDMGQAAGKEAAVYMKKLLKEKETISVMFGAAPSQNEVLAALCESDVDWTRVNAFHMDEYVGLPESHPAGFRNFLKRAIFDKLPFRSVHYINGNAEDPEEECIRYDKLLREYKLDVCMLGIGENGHIAFNDPGVAKFMDPVMVKIAKIDDVCRMQQVHDGCFAALEEVPKSAITVTVPGLCSASGMYCVVPAKTKANAVKLTLEGPITEEVPATILRMQDYAFLYTDKDSASLIL